MEGSISRVPSVSKSLFFSGMQDGTNVGISHAGPDARLSEIGGYIQEAIESYEMEIGGKSVPIKAIRNLTGHSIDLYRIHAGMRLAACMVDALPCSFSASFTLTSQSSLVGRWIVTVERRHSREANAVFGW